ncbi:MAG: hypothetical protein LBS91_09500 [Clostridiales Family XIII bacterium]|jgi:formate C-acetyltransferase|nr:hypothetical protein [Clostridiales Family XIII bacterium]
MMYAFSSVSDRALRIRDRYRETTPRFSAERSRLITEFYQSHGTEYSQLKRAKCMRHVYENMTILVGDDDLIVGNLAPTFRGSALNPEYGGVAWMADELESGEYYKREIHEELNYIDEEDAQYILSIRGYWDKHSLMAYCDAVIPDEFCPVENASIIPFYGHGACRSPVGHFSANYKKAIDVGFAAIKAEAQEKLKAMEGHIYAGEAEKNLFYRSIVIYCDAICLLAKRYAAECRRLADECRFSEERRKELLSMADSLGHIIEHPARSFYEAVQAAYLYHLALCIEGQLHGLTLGRFDQYVYPYLKADMESGRITREQAQEIVDCFFLKVSEDVVAKNKEWANSSGGYSTGQHMSLGGVHKDGTDATNDVSFMMLEASARLHLHQPPLSLRVHDETPEALWEAAVACTKECGGIPTLQSDKAIIPSLMTRGFTLEDARDYCIIGCVEPGGGGNDFPCCGGTGHTTYLNLGNIIVMLVNNGINPFTGKDSGFGTGHLYDYKNFGEVMEAYKKQIDHYVNWQITMTNLFFVVMKEKMPLPGASATMEGCMEKGRDVMYGGAKYNSTGASGVGCANVVDSLVAIKYLCFDENICTTRELYDAILSDWDGKEDLRQTILNQVPRYGNALEYADGIAKESLDYFADALQRGSADRGNPFSCGMYPVSTHLIHGAHSWATPDGRKAGEALAEGISPKQGLDRNGPTAVLRSVSAFDHKKYRNGTLLNMRFHPASVRGDDGTAKLRNLVETFFNMGGMHIQYNIVGSDTLRAAQSDPETYKNLVIRIAGFSAYFVELDEALQNDLILRTEQAV